MVVWQYLETYATGSVGKFPLLHRVLPAYCSPDGFDANTDYTLTELGKEGWNLTYVLSQDDFGNCRFIFRRSA